MTGMHIQLRKLWSRQLTYLGCVELKVSGRLEAPEEPKLEFRVHLMGLSSEDKHNIQSNPKHIPGPTVNNMLSSRFFLPIGMDITYELDLLVSLVRRLITSFQLPSPSGE